LRADEKHIRAQSAILYKTLKSCLVLTMTESLRGSAFHPRKNTVGARSAQVLAKPARTKNPSVRIVACARMMKPSARKRRSLRNSFSSS
jgi:hypothetical protein